MTEQNQNPNETNGFRFDRAPQPDSTQLRNRAEEHAAALGPEKLEVLSPGQIDRLVHELRVHQIELEL
jgi:hypothetical protein